MLTLSLELAQTIMRVGMGSFFTATGFNKLFDPATREEVQGLFAKLNVPKPERQVIPWGEFLGGLGLLTGTLTREAAIGLIVIMCGALMLDVLPEWWGKPHKNLADWIAKLWMIPEVNMTLFLIVITLVGPGPLSLDHLLGWRF